MIGIRLLLSLLLPLGTAAGIAAPAAAQDNAPAMEAEPPAQPTPMRERVAVIAVLDKVSQKTAEYEVNPGDRIEFRALSIRVRACETTPPWEPRPLTGAFLQIDVKRTGQQPRRAFSGWLFAESPALNSFDNTAYDVWVKSCTMDFPDTGSDTISVN